MSHLDTTKISRAFLTSAVIGELGTKFELNLGKMEVAELLAVHRHVNMSDPDHLIRYGVYRKSDSQPADIDNELAVREDKDWLLWTAVHSGVVGFLGPIVFDEMTFFPPGIVMVRSPRLAASNVMNITYELMLTIYYRIKTVSKDELAKLMVKYHA